MKDKTFTLEKEEWIPDNIEGNITKASFVFCSLNKLNTWITFFIFFSTELCLNSSTIHTQNARNVLRNIVEIIRSRKSIKDIQYYGKKRKEQKYKQWSTKHKTEL